MKKTVVSTLVLTLICLVIVSLLVLTNEVTRDRIARAEKEAREKAITSVLVGAEGEPEMLAEDVYLGKDAQGNIVGYAFLTSAKGYGGEVSCVVGIGTDGRILAVSVSAPDETPGLGANVAKDAFVDQFKDKNKVSYAADFEAVTSATYSSEAVKASIDAAFARFEEVQNKTEGGEA